MLRAILKRTRMDSKSLMILGRQPALGIAELESLFGPAAIKPVGNNAALLNVPSDKVDFDRLGGTIKLAQVLTIINSRNWRDIQHFLTEQAAQYFDTIPEGKIQVGISLYGIHASAPQVNAAGLTLKKAIRKTGRSVRLTPNKEIELNSAQVLHNHLTGNTGWEFIFVQDGNQTICARTIRVQDINAYTVRDRGRPKRDAKVGMLPPKLAQIIVNLAAGNQLAPGATLLDPFCGTGVVLQEAALMGLSPYGTDLEPRMIAYSKANLTWLTERMPVREPLLEVGDATMHTWQPPIDVIACETYLGQAFNSLPAPDKLDSVVKTCNLIIEKFLKNIHGQLRPGTRLCLAVPAWQQRTGYFKHLQLLDHLQDMGYNRLDLMHVHREDLVYSRSDQIVGRELLIITRK